MSASKMSVVGLSDWDSPPALKSSLVCRHVLKQSNDRQRAIWNGSSISEPAAAPPMPPRLAKPSSFLEMLLEPGEKPASAYFSTLRAPQALQPFYGRPCVTVQELMTAAGLPQEGIRKCVGDHPDSVTVGTKVFPAPTV